MKDEIGLFGIEETAQLAVNPYYELARQGDMRKIEAWATALEGRDNRFSRFAGKLRVLAGGVKGDGIC